MLSTSRQASPLPQYITVKHDNGKSQNLEFGKGQKAEEIMAALIIQHATGGTKKNFLKAGRSYDVVFRGEHLKITPSQDIFIISRTTPKSKELSLSVRFFTQKVLGKGSFGQVRELAGTKCHIKYEANKEPVAMISDVHKRKVVKEVKVTDQRSIEELAKENKNFALIHDGTGRGESHKEVYTDFDTDPAQPVSRMVMARFKGKTLDEVIAENLSMDERLEVATGLAKQVKKVHDHGLVIVDLKLENAMHSRKDHETRIIDTAFVPHGHTGASAFTIYTASPEVMYNYVENAGIPLDYSSDIFSLAVVIACIICGKHYGDELPASLDQRPDRMQAMIEILEGKYPGYSIQDFIKQIRTINPNVPLKLIDLLLKMTDKDPAERPTLMEAIVTMELLKGPKEALKALTDQVNNLKTATDQEIRAQQELIKQLRTDANAKQPQIDQLKNLKKQVDDLKKKAELMAKSPLIQESQRQTCQIQYQALARVSDNIGKIIVSIQQANISINTAKITTLTSQMQKLKEATHKEIEKEQGLIQRLESDFNASQPEASQLVNLKKQIDELKKNIKEIASLPSMKKYQQHICHESDKSLTALSSRIEAAMATIQRANSVANTAKVNAANAAKLKTLADQVNNLKTATGQEIRVQQGLIKQLNTDFNAKRPSDGQLTDLKKQADDLKIKTDLMLKSNLTPEQRKLCQKQYQALGTMTNSTEKTIDDIRQTNNMANNIADLRQEIKIGYDLYVQLSEGTNESFLSVDQRTNLLSWCSRVKKSTTNIPGYKKIFESASSIEKTITSTGYSSNFFGSKGSKDSLSRMRLACLSRLKSFFEMIHFYPKFGEDVKAYEEKRNVLKPLGEVAKETTRFKPA